MGIKLSPLDITYKKRKAIKSQVLPDFTVEWLELQNTEPPGALSVWTMYFRRIKKGSRSRSSLNIPARRQAQICDKDEFPTSF
jgi:hypothetical protein